jgi:hypothetical protein
MRRRLSLFGLKPCRSCELPLLTGVMKRKRSAWPKEHVQWPPVHWDSVTFSDESKFNLHVCDGKQCVWRRSSQAVPYDSKKNQMATCPVHCVRSVSRSLCSVVAVLVG